MIFKNGHTRKNIVNVIDYIKNYIATNDVLIYVGTDSQHKKRGKFAFYSVIAFRRTNQNWVQQLMTESCDMKY
jgi:predicted RNase H-related nuclease YkuK (DUF458 family)